MKKGMKRWYVETTCYDYDDNPHYVEFVIYAPNEKEAVYKAWIKCGEGYYYGGLLNKVYRYEIPGDKTSKTYIDLRAIERL